MSKKYILQFSKNVQIPITVGIDTSASGWLITVIQNILWFVWIISLPVSILFSQNTGVVTIINLYIFIVLCFGLLITKNLFFKQKINIPVPHDLLLLFFTTVLTTSLLVTTLNTNINYNIFGGNDYRMFSGISMMALGGLYYLFIHQNIAQKYFAKLNIYMIGMLIAVVFSVLDKFDGKINTGLLSTLIVLSPGLLWLSMKKVGLRYVNFILFVFGIVFLITAQKSYLYFVIAVIYIPICIGGLLRNIKIIKNQVNRLIKDVKAVISKKKKASELVVKNTEIIFIIITGIISIISIIVWLSTGSEITFRGQVLLSDGINLWLGHGLTGGRPSSVFIGMIYATGLIVSMVFIALIIVMIKQMVRSFKDDETAYFFVLTLSASVIYFLLLPVETLTIISIWLMMGFSSVFYLQKIVKYNIKSKLIKREYNLFTDKEFIKLNKWIPYIMVTGLVFLIIYTINLWTVKRNLQYGFYF